jgi:hypothetical protein
MSVRELGSKMVKETTSWAPTQVGGGASRQMVEVQAGRCLENNLDESSKSSAGKHSPWPDVLAPGIESSKTDWGIGT